MKESSAFQKINMMMKNKRNTNNGSQYNTGYDDVPERIDTGGGEYYH